MEIEKEIMRHASNLKIAETSSIAVIQGQVHSILQNHYYPLFVNSLTYQFLIRDITRQQIYYHRIMNCSNSRRFQSEMQETISNLYE